MMRDISIGKITLNIGVGESGEKLEKAKALLEVITDAKAVKTKTYKRIPTWNLRPGMEIGTMITLRGKKAMALLARLFEAVDKKIKSSSFDNSGNVSFGIHEYIDIPGVNYDPKIGIIGLDVAITFKRPGYSAEKIGKKHKIKPGESMEFIKKSFGVEIV